MLISPNSAVQQTTTREVITTASYCKHLCCTLGERSELEVILDQISWVWYDISFINFIDFWWDSLNPWINQITRIWHKTADSWPIFSHCYSLFIQLNQCNNIFISLANASWPSLKSSQSSDIIKCSIPYSDPSLWFNSITKLSAITIPQIQGHSV